MIRKNGQMLHGFRVVDEYWRILRSRAAMASVTASREFSLAVARLRPEDIIKEELGRRVNVYVTKETEMRIRDLAETMAQGGKSGWWLAHVCNSAVRVAAGIPKAKYPKREAGTHAKRRKK